MENKTMENNSELDLNLNLKEKEEEVFITENQINILYSLLKEELLIRQQLVSTTLPLCMPDLTTSAKVMPILSSVGTKYSVDPCNGQIGLQGYLESLYKKAKNSSDFHDIMYKILGSMENLVPLLEQCRYYYTKAYQEKSNVLSKDDLDYLNTMVGLYISSVQSAISATVKGLLSGMITRRKKNLSVKKYDEIYKYINDNKSVLTTAIESSLSISTEEDGENVPQCELENMYN